MDHKGGLGKGISVLFGNKNIDPDNVTGEGTKTETKEQLYIETEKIKRNPYQPREDFNEEELKELSDSIKQKGVLQPLTVMNAKDGQGYILISGERRLRAAVLAGLKAVPAYVYNTTDDSKENLLELALIENVQRSDLNPMELSDSYQMLVDDCSLTQEQIASKVSKQRSTVANYLRLQKLPVEVKVSLRKNEITEGHARGILRVNDPAAQLVLWQRIMREKITVRELEGITQPTAKPKRKKSSTKNKETKDPYLQEMENKMRLFFGTRVTIKAKTKQTGEIIIDYFSNEDLERIIELSERKSS
ncbi:MAG: ParB/RepB/Spo0J family partition protein [Ignavibacteria bacterium]